ncbi:MAG TPA: 2Fe-2S iron-sulfur cluster-binding protein [Ilumatobacter sp.]|nr:2Fe-2S iron-sulfur cluster-binding protein [Ilumatobacter sp.]
MIEFTLNGAGVSAPAEGSLLDALRESLGVRSAKDGCSPQGQCGCCTVWVDGQARVACVTPISRVAGRAVTTVEGLADADEWAARFTACGASQCGFCTPGIVMRLAAMAPERRSDPAAVEQALLAHLCRCTGWQPIVDAATHASDPAPCVTEAAQRRAALEGGVPQAVGPQVALGQGGFADDTAPGDALVAALGADGEWVVGETLAEARRLSGKVQGRRTTAPLTWPIEVPDEPTGEEWARTLRTTWVEPAYLEPDAAWCLPGGEPVSSHGNGGAFGAKQTGAVERAARELADRHGRAVRVLYTREDVVRRGPKRPPLAAGVRADGTGIVHVARTPGLAEAAERLAPGFDVVEVDVTGPPTSLDLRGAVWAELAVLRASLSEGPAFTVTAPGGATATARIDDAGVHIQVDAGDPLDATVLRSYCTGAAHMALGWVRSEGLSVGDDGVPHDLTIRSFGVLRAVDTPPLDITLAASGDAPVAASQAVFAAVATAAWAHAGYPPQWPTGHAS